MDDTNFAETSPSTKEQLDALQKLFGQISIPSQVTLTTSHQHTSMLACQGTIFSAFATKIKKSKPWIYIVDFGASNHMTGDISIFLHFILIPCVSTVRIAEGSLSKVVGVGANSINKGYYSLFCSLYMFQP